ncbi:hypothetical protein SPWS13_1771 [Shewanella putrefaciens]|nr:hypothetical protein SPWS13_1771 [Shewanella putrefaciens]
MLADLLESELSQAVNPSVIVIVVQITLHILIAIRTPSATYVVEM